MHTHTHAHTHMHTYTHMYTHMYTHTHTYTHTPEMGMKESQKAQKCGSGGCRRPLIGGRGQSPLKLKAFSFLNLRYEKPHFLALYPVSNSYSPNTLYCALRLSSRGNNQATPASKVRGQSPLKLKPFSTSKVWKIPFPGTSPGFKQSQNTLYCTLRLKEQTRLRQRSISKDYTLNINNKGCTHDHLSSWSYVLIYVSRSSCQQLTNDSIQKRKQVCSL